MYICTKYHSERISYIHIIKLVEFMINGSIKYYHTCMASQQITGVVGRGVGSIVRVGPVHSRLTVVTRVTWSSHISGALY